MEAKICVCLHNVKPTLLSSSLLTRNTAERQHESKEVQMQLEEEQYHTKALSCSTGNPNTINFTCPQSLEKLNFPVHEATFHVEQLLVNPTAQIISQNLLSETAEKFVSSRQNLVVFGYGVRSTPRRELMYGAAVSTNDNRHEHVHHNNNIGYAQEIITRVVAKINSNNSNNNSNNNNSNNNHGNTNTIITLSCYAMAYNEHVIDLINAENDIGVIIDSVKEGPRVRMIERAKVESAEQVNEIFNEHIIPNYTREFANVLALHAQSPDTNNGANMEQSHVLAPYHEQTIILQLLRYENDDAFANYDDANSMSFIALADSERPVLCGIDPEQQLTYERVHRTLMSAINMVSSIRCNRLRIPFGKSKLSQMLRRAYNAERNNTHNSQNGPTITCLLLHCFMEAAWAEESYHALTLMRRISNPVGFTLIGSPLRDLMVEKWRLDHDIAELKDELIIAKSVYEYKPCIVESNKTLTNIREEENKRITAIQSKRDEIRERQLTLLRQRANEEAEKIIKQQEAASGTTLHQLEETLTLKRQENANLQADREQRTKEYEQSLEKLRRKRDDEEKNVNGLTEELSRLEAELAMRQNSLQSKQQQLNLAKLDKTKCHDALQRERESVEAARHTVCEDRWRQRQMWVRQIKEINNKVMEQVKTLTEERQRYGEQASAHETAAENAIKEDVSMIEEYLPKLIALEDAPVHLEEVERLRRQFDEMLTHEKNNYTLKIDSEKLRKEKLEKGLELYRMRILEAAQAKKQENVQSTVEKEQHLNALMTQVFVYLRQGVRMTKISSKGHVRRRFYFLSEDCKRIHSCELDNQGGPLNRRKPPVTIWLKDVKKIVVGIYTSSFINFSSEAQLERTRMECVNDNGTYRTEPTQNITPANLGVNNYRSFALLLKGNKSLEVVCDCDSDCEAWLVALKRLLNIKTSVEKLVEQIVRSGEKLLPNAVVTAVEESVDKTASITTTTTTTNTLTSVAGNVEMSYGGRLDIRNMRGFVSLSPDEAELCSTRHIPPALFLRVKQEVIDKAVNEVVSIYDVRVSSGLDLIRSGFVYDYLVEKRLIALPV